MKNSKTMNVVNVLSKVPWSLVIEAAPQLIDKSKEIILSLKKGESTEGAAIEEMAELLNRQGELIEALSEQNQQLHQAVQILAKKQKMLFLIAIIGLLLGMGSMLIMTLS